MAEKSNQNVHTHTVRPRWTWAALLLMTAGLVLIGVAILVPSWRWAIAGLVIGVVGGLVALYGGFFYAVQGGDSPSTQLHDVVEGTEYEFPGADTKRSEAEVERDVRRRWVRRR